MGERTDRQTLAAIHVPRRLVCVCVVARGRKASERSRIEFTLEERIVCRSERDFAGRRYLIEQLE